VINKTVRAYCLWLGVALLPTIAYGIDCSGLPTSFGGDEFPSGNFVSNFDNPCYLIPLGSGQGGNRGGDLDAVYDKISYKVDPRYQLIILGTFENSRYFSITAYDDHGAIGQSILDTNIVPLTTQFVNPFAPGVAFVAGQKYGVAVNFGGTPGQLQTGCMIPSQYNVDVNGLDATQRHAGINWNLDPGVFQTFSNFPLHQTDTPQHTNPNGGGVLMIRNYLDLTARSFQTSPHIIVRDVASGCAYPAAYVMSSLQVVSTSLSWLNHSQLNAHRQYDEDYLPELCFASNSQNHILWSRSGEWVSGINPNASYIQAQVPSGLPATLAQDGRVMRMRFRVASAPPTPCTNGCSRSGTEQIRYMSLSFENPGAITLASLADNAFTQDANGYVTLIVGTGAQIPSWITSANGYTLLDLTAIPNFGELQKLSIRDILPSSNFQCSGYAVPFRTSEYTPAGGLMGEYLPVVDYPVAASLPTTAVALTGSDACGVIPNGQPADLPACQVLPFPSAAITQVSTQCAAPGCNQVVVQTQPPISLVGQGFGDFPNGLPYAGTSNYLELIDTTQNWSAGYTGNLCDVSIGNWYDTSISMVANVNQGGLCPLAAGDQLIINVWNPQTMSSMSANVTVAPN